MARETSATSHLQPPRYGPYLHKVTGAIKDVDDQGFADSMNTGVGLGHKKTISEVFENEAQAAASRAAATSSYASANRLNAKSPHEVEL